MQLIRPLRPITSLFLKNSYLFASRFPSFKGKYSTETNSIHILHSNEAEGNVPVHKLK
jgi:hypothetical protein